ncbi:PQQ-binding-like beta-propeller repeat protein [Streptomyces sp. Mg1]|uniref:outer membrane protein assembly factor BamB family protein n=1 Tax=Streptomyces sp. Mg1 TaxID=465541 RepID=UPI00131A2775|nr:PQQ-binding-like beta-propeller repeat protein [Streptomyces sp. Mg1]
MHTSLYMCCCLLSRPLQGTSHNTRDIGTKAFGQRLSDVPAVRDGVVYANEGARGLVAVDALTGAERWSEIPLKDFRAAPDTTPAVGAGYVYAMDMTGLRAVDLRTHRPAWRYPTPATTLTPDPDNTRLYAREESRMLAFPME